MAIKRQNGIRLVLASVFAGMMAIGSAGIVASPAAAMSQPKPDPSPTGKPNCAFGQSYSKKKGKCVAVKTCKDGQRWSKYNGACVQRRSDALTDPGLYKEARWLIETKQYAEARDLLFTMHDQENPKVLNYIGFTTRKLGDVDKGITYYMKALARDPNLNIAREYLGEGYLQKGDLASAKAQLAEIAKRCTGECPEYEVLAEAIGNFILGEPIPQTW